MQPPIVSLLLSYCRLCVCTCIPLSLLGSGSVASQCLGKRVPVAANPHATIEELLNVSFSVCSVLNERKIVNDFFLALLD
jgi:hypothetical protein